MYGEKIRSWCRECGIATDSFITLPGKNSSSYVSIHRSDGEMAVALSDMRILQELTPARLEPMRDKLSAAAAIVVDGCLPQETLRYIIRTFGGSVPIFADPVSTAYARRMRPVLRGIDTLKPNRLEAEILSGRSIRCEADYFRAAEGILAAVQRGAALLAGGYHGLCHGCGAGGFAGPHHHQSSDQSGAHLAAGAGAEAPPYPGDPHRSYREIMPQDSSFVMNPAAK